ARQARAVALLARRSDAERLAQHGAEKVNEAADAKLAEDLAVERVSWRIGEEAELEADTRRLLDEAGRPGTDPGVVVRNGRVVAVRLLTRGGPWVVEAAKLALAGGDA